MTPTTHSRPRRVLGALTALVKNPEDTRHVFTIIEGLAGATHERIAARLRTTAEGSRLLTERPDILQRLADRDALAALPEGSLGRAYLAFLDREGITPAGLVAASAAGESSDWHARDDAAGWVSRRLRDTHDLWHVVTGYEGDLLGEAALLAFSSAQTGHRGAALMSLVAVGRTRDGELARRVAAAWWAGRRAAFLPAFRFEDALARPLVDVRAELRVAPAAPYPRMRSDWTRAAA